MFRALAHQSRAALRTAFFQAGDTWPVLLTMTAFWTEAIPYRSKSKAAWMSILRFIVHYPFLLKKPGRGWKGRSLRPDLAGP